MRRIAICWLAMVLSAVVLGFCQTTTIKQTTGSRFPVVVARVARWHQTAPINGTLFTPKHFGVYRASGVVVITKQGEVGVLYVNITAKDGAGTHLFQWAGDDAVGDISGSSPPFRDLHGVPIEYSTMFTTTGTEYNLFIVVEQIM
jgi:hypothetical protein